MANSMTSARNKLSRRAMRPGRSPANLPQLPPACLELCFQFTPKLSVESRGSSGKGDRKKYLERDV